MKEEIMNLILIMSDSLRPDCLGVCGKYKIKTPNIDRLAKQSFIFENAIAESPITVPARTAISTGKYTFTNRYWSPLKETDITLPEILNQNGYQTAIIGDTPPAMDPKYNFSTRFKFFQWIRGQWSDIEYKGLGREMKEKDRLIPNNILEAEVPMYEIYLKNLKELREKNDSFPGRVTRSAIKWLKEHRKERFFLWVDYFDPHEPWDPPSPYDKMYDPDYDGPFYPIPPGPESTGYTQRELRNIFSLYCGEVTYCDKYIGELLKEIENLGLFNDSLIIYLSDHGEPLGEHNIMRKLAPCLYNELVKIVLFIKLPGASVPRRISSLVSNIDIFPTVLNILEIPFPSNVQGRSLVPLLNDDFTQWNNISFAGYYHENKNPSLGDFSVRMGNWKFIRHFGKYYSKSEDNIPENSSVWEELFNLKNDPNEKRNLISKRVEKAHTLRGVLDKFLRNNFQKN